MSSPRRDLVILGAASVLLTLLFFSPTDNWRWDPSFYYAQLRSPIIDRDLDFRDETIPRDGVSRRTVTGLQPSPWPIGPSLLWGPFFLAAHVYVAVQPGISAENGFAAPYIAAVASGSALYGLLGVWVTYRVGRFFGSRPLVTVTTLMVLMATPLFFYVFRQPFMAHSTSFLASASLLLVCLMADNGSLKQAHTGLAIGVCIGLCVLARWTSVLLALIPLTLFVAHVGQAVRAHDTEQIKANVTQFCYAGLATLVVVSPQLALWYKLHNAWLVFPSQGFSASLLPTNLLNLFVHTNRGILFWTPFIVGGLLGLVFVRPLRLRVALVTYMLAHLYVLSVWNDWYGGGGYGPRYFIETLPVVAIGFISLARGIWQRPGGKYLVTAFAVSVVVHQLVLLTIVEQAWLPLPDYFGGKPLGLRFQLDGFTRLLAQPGNFLLPRINVATERQSAAANLFAGHTYPMLYYMPLVALIVIPAGLVLCGYLEKFPKARFLSYAVMVYMLGWFGFLLSIET